MTRTSHRTVAVTAIVALTTLAGATSAQAHGPVVRSSGALTDLQPATTGALDGAWGRVKLVETGWGTRVVFRVKGVDAPDGTTYGAHLHAGPCVAGDGAAAGPHYNTDLIAGVPAGEAEVSEDTEVWLDVSLHHGRATSTASVPFVPLAGERSVVVHALPTDPTSGLAGGRLACLPVVW